MTVEIAKVFEALIKAEKELEALWSYYGHNLIVHNWHLNGAGEPLDNFFDDCHFGALDDIRVVISSQGIEQKEEVEISPDL